MNPFTYVRAGDVADALHEVGSQDAAKFIAGGTNLIDLMKTRDNFKQVADAILREAKGFGYNDFKVELARRAIVRALGQAATTESHP
jgi:CO/xanthine dehydrogenase FAD-binding subunit